MSRLDLYRGILQFIYFLVIYNLVYFVVIYVKVIFPLKSQIKEGILLAPPVRTTLAYHLTVGYLVLVLSGATIYSMRNDRPLNPVSVMLVPGLLVLIYLLRMFRLSYAERLSRASKPPVESDS